MSERRNPYHVLGLKKGATETEIKEAYKLLARKHHPDRNPNDPGARDRFIEIKEAYEDLIERKTSSPVLAQVEETNAEFRRGGGYRRIFTIATVGVLAVAAGLGGFFFREELEFRARMALAGSGDAKAAEKWLGPLTSGTGPRAEEARMVLVKRGLAGGDAALVKRALETSTSPAGLALLGDLSVKDGKRDEARKAYERAIAAAKDAQASAQAYAGLLAARDDAAAARVLQDAQTRYQAKGDPWLTWMVALRDLRSGKPQLANRALADQTTPAAKAVRAAALVSSARLLGDDALRYPERKALVAEAMTLIDQAAPAGVPGEFGWLRPGAAILRQRPFDWRPATSLEPVESSRHMMRSAAKFALGRDREDQSAGVEHAAVARDEGTFESLLFLGAAHLQRNVHDGHSDDPAQAKGFFGLARAMSPKSAKPIAGQALAMANAAPDPFRMKKEYEDELATWREAIALEPDNAEWHFGYARSLARGGRERSAARISENRQAIRLSADYGAPRLDLADAFFDAGQDGEAVKALQAATGVDEVAVRAWRVLGDYGYERGQFAAARDAYLKATADPQATTQAKAWLGVARSEGRLRRVNEGRAALRNAIALDEHLKPDQNDPALAAALSGGTFNKGIEMADEAMRLAPELYGRGQLYHALGAYTVGSLHGGDVETRAKAWYGMALCFARLGDLDEAMRCMDRALYLFPALTLDEKDEGVKRLLAAGYGASRKARP